MERLRALRKLPLKEDGREAGEWLEGYTLSKEYDMAHTVGEKGQVVIEKAIREALGIQPGFVAVQSLVEDHLEIRFLPPEHDRSLRGALASYVRRSVSEDEWEGARQQAWSDATAHRKPGDEA